MINSLSRTVAFVPLLIVAASLNAADVSNYRQFQLSSNLAEIASEAGVKPAKAKTLYERPEIIQQLLWRADPDDSVMEIAFAFYNGDLYRMVVSYDNHKTEGLTAGDMIDAVTSMYGTGIDPSTEITISSIYDDSENVKVLGRWEGSGWSLNLVRSKYLSTFYLVGFSKTLEPLAHAAVTEAIRLDIVEAPQRATARRDEVEKQERLKREKARLANRPDFRP